MRGVLDRRKELEPSSTPNPRHFNSIMIFPPTKSLKAEWAEKLKAYESKFPDLFEEPHLQVDFFVDYTGERSFQPPVPKIDLKPDLQNAPTSRVKMVKDVLLCAVQKAKQALYYGFIYYWRMVLHLNLIVIAHYWARWGSPPFMFIPFILP